MGNAANAEGWLDIRVGGTHMGWHLARNLEEWDGTLLEKWMIHAFIILSSCSLPDVVVFGFGPESCLCSISKGIG